MTVTYTGGTLYTSTKPANVVLTAAGIAGTAELTADALTGGTQDYLWTFTPNDITNYSSATGTVRLTVVTAALSGISVTTLPNKTAYTFGETLDPAGMVVTAAYSDGSSAPVTGYEVQ